jgi:phosphotriesterase-related protein
MVLAEMIRRGYADRIMLSHDYVAKWLGRPFEFPAVFQSLLANYHPTHLFKNVIPALKDRGVTDAQIRTIIEENPRRIFAGD